MYTIIAYDNPTDTVGRVIFDPRIRKTISSGSLTLKESDIDDFQLTVNQSNVLFGNVKPLLTHVEIRQDNQIIFRGRALKPKREMTSSGQFIQSFSFESISAYLLDSVQRFKEVHDTTVADFFRMIIDVHNSQVPAYKQFKAGKITVTNSTDNVYRFLDYSDTLTTIQDKLISRLGGYLQFRFESDGNYIDYLQNIGVDHANDNPIKIGRNLQSASVEIDPTNVITRLVPVGATIESENNSGDQASDVSRPRVTIASVNGGKDYLDIPDLQNEFGIINGTQMWDDVTQPSSLLSKAKSWISNQTVAVDSWSITAVEIGLSNLTSFRVSDRYLFVNRTVAEPQMLRIIKKTIDFLSPHKSSLEIGNKSKSLTDYQRDSNVIVKQAAALKAQVASLSSTTLKVDQKAQEAINTANAMKETVEKLETDLNNADLASVKTDVAIIKNQQDTIITNLGEMSQATIDLQTFKADQLALNSELNTKIADLTSRIEILEGGTN